jgi:hypothetical protein
MQAMREMFRYFLIFVQVSQAAPLVCTWRVDEGGHTQIRKCMQSHEINKRRIKKEFVIKGNSLRR